jgi:hypothetical protein
MAARSRINTKFIFILLVTLMTGGMVVGGLLYLPLCLFEMQMSPRLHSIVYGYHQHSFGQHIRGDGYRPKVFMQHGLATALWMATASLVGVWLWMTGAVRKLSNIPMAYLVPSLIVTTAMCRSVGALVLLTVGVMAFFTTKVAGKGTRLFQEHAHVA